ncbi:MAG: S-layer homology domain-containing protein [Acidobacteria bacterium]|nr:S-layer homology domain-containing protein [Acidobacteriota bacterium]
MKVFSKMLSFLVVLVLAPLVVPNVGAQGRAFTCPDQVAVGIPPAQAISALAQPPQRKRPDSFGGGLQYMYVHASQFLPFGHQVLPDYSPGTGYVTPHDDGSNYSPAYWVQLNLPNGAEIDDVYANVYDNTPNASWRLFVTVYEHDGSPSYSYLSDTTESGTPGYTSLPASFSTPPVFHEWANIDGDSSYGDVAFTFALVPQGTYSEVFALRFGGVSVGWKRTISPAPAGATFNDVPVGSFGFQQIEALAASGITAGCGGGNFCPNGTLTRAQMAVFLAKALGLHWSL